MKEVNLKKVIFEYENGSQITLEGKDLQEWVLYLNQISNELFLLENRNI